MRNCRARVEAYPRGASQSQSWKRTGPERAGDQRGVRAFQSRPPVRTLIRTHKKTIKPPVVEAWSLVKRTGDPSRQGPALHPASRGFRVRGSKLFHSIPHLARWQRILAVRLSLRKSELCRPVTRWRSRSREVSPDFTSGCWSIPYVECPSTIVNKHPHSNKSSRRLCCKLPA